MEASSQEPIYLLLSLKWTKPHHDVLTWWAPNSSGYVTSIDHAGRYSEAQARAVVPGDTTVMVPVELVEQHSKRVVRNELSLFTTEVPIDNRAPDEPDTCSFCGRSDDEEADEDEQEEWDDEEELPPKALRHSTG
jgi:hypothetical protein